jgi:hypothetical protein
MPSNYQRSALLEPLILKSHGPTTVRQTCSAPARRDPAPRSTSSPPIASMTPRLNRVIEVAGISKGSMYYYFDGKEDLYAHVARVELLRLFAAVGPLTIPVAADPDAFWSRLESHYLQLMTTLAPSRNWLR